MGIRKRAGRDGFQVDWTNPFSKRRHFITVKTIEEAKKQDALLKFRLQFERDSFRDEDAELPTKEEKPDTSLETIDYLYLKEKRFGEKRMTWHLDGMNDALSIIGRKEIDAITEKDLSAVLTRQSMKAVKPVTVRNRMRILYTVLRWAYKRGYLSTMPRLPELPEARYEKFVPPTDEEAADLFAVAPDHVRRCIILGARLGVRVGPSELFKIKWSDVDLVRAVVRVPAALKNRNEPWREVPIKKTLLPLFAFWKEQDENECADFLIHFNNKPVKSIKTAWTATLRRAGITRRIRPYDLRHAFATDAIAAGADVGTIAKLMGHTSPAMILSHYQHVLTRQKIEAVEALPDIETAFFPYENGPASMDPKEKRLTYLQ